MGFSLDVVGLGFPRCGTTWISKCLADHPQIDFAQDANGHSAKETHFFNFDYEFEKGLAWYQQEYFSHAKEGHLTGEFTTLYFEEEKTLKRIKAAFPNVKVLISLRNPYDRAFSHFLYRKRKGGEPKTFAELFDNDPHKVLAWSNYYPYLKTILAHFDRDQVCIVVHDDNEQDKTKFIQSIYAFLGVDASFVPESLHADINRSKNLRYYIPQFQWIFAYRYTLKKYAVGRFLIAALKLLRINKLIILLRDLNKKPPQATESEQLLPADRAKLADMLRSDVVKLEILLERDFSAWKQ